jgi:2-dehydropantoate 2-reductase
MRIVIVGAGAMGSIFGARFAQADHDVVLLDVVESLVDRINADGVTIVRDETETTTRVHATTDPFSVGVADVVVFFTKCYHTSSAAERARPVVGPDTVVASLQNGWGNGDVLAGAYPADSITLGVTYNSGLLLEPGRVVHPSDQPTIVGSFTDGDTAGARRLAQALGDADFETTVASPVRPEIWKKLILNAATLPTSALTGMIAAKLTEIPEIHALVTDVAKEAVAVARALGYDISQEERVETIHALLGKAGPSKASMLQDFEAGRRTEIDVINGAVVKAADETGVEVPLNRTLVRLVKGWEAMRGLA